MAVYTTVDFEAADALLQSLRECGATAALVIGDDANDEPAFIKAPAGSVSIRIGSWAVATQARFRLSRQSQVDTLLHLLLALRR